MPAEQISDDDFLDIFVQPEQVTARQTDDDFLDSFVQKEPVQSDDDFLDSFAQPEPLAARVTDFLGKPGDAEGVVRLSDESPDTFLDRFVDDEAGDDIVEASVKALQNLPARAQRMAGGLLRYFGESPLNTPHVYELPLPREAYGPDRFERFLTETGTSIAADALEKLKANAPDVEPGSAPFYVSSIIGAVAEMVPALSASMVTRNPNVGLSMIGSQVFGDKYAQSREEGRSINESRADAMVYTASEVITEKIPLGILTKEGGSALKRVLKSAGAEGLQEPINQAIQTAYDVGISEDVTFAEAVKNPEVWAELRDAAIIGFGAGGSLGAIAGVGDTAIQRMQREAEAVMAAPTVEDAITTAEAALAPTAGDAISVAEEVLSTEAAVESEPLPEAEEIVSEAPTEPLTADEFLDQMLEEAPLDERIIEPIVEVPRGTTVDPREAALADTDLSQVMLPREVIEEETGDIYDIEESADVVLTRQKKRVEIMNKLSECLNS